MNKIHLNYLKRKSVYHIRKQLKLIRSSSKAPKKCNSLIISTQHELSETMIYPFYWYEKELEDIGIKHCEIRLTDLVKEASSQQSPTKQNHIEHIYFQAEFEMPKEALTGTLKFLKDAFPNAKIAFMDWFAPLHIRPSEIANEFIDYYIVKQTYRDFDQYTVPTIGDTNLSHYYAERHNLPLETMQFEPPKGIDKKIVLWSNFGLSPQMVDLFLGSKPTKANRPIDLHARIAVKGVDWYQAMRQEAKDAVQNLSPLNLKIASEGRVKRYKFFEEMKMSKLCFSPFGYGEVCWRDYEAFATGALLLKPNMDHLITHPDIFIPNETYVSLDWDLSDFEEKVTFYLENEQESARILSNSFDVMQQSIQNKSVLNLIEMTL